MRNLLAILFTALACHAASGLDNAIRIQDGPISTNTHSSRVTITGMTNLNAATLNATNSVNVGQPGEAGLVSILATNGVPYAAFDPTNSLTFGTNIFTYGAQNNAVISGLRLTGLGDPVSTGFFLENADSLSFNADAWIDGYAYTVGTTNAHSQIDAKATTGSGDAEFGVDVLSSAAPRVSVTGMFANKGFTLEPTIADGSTPYTLDTSLAHTSGNLLEVYNFGTLKYELGYDAHFYTYGGGGDFIAFNGANIGASTTWGVMNFQSMFIHADGASRVAFSPLTADGTTPHSLDTSLAHTTGNLVEIKNHGIDWVKVPADQAATNAPLILNINGTDKRVHVGAPDSGGTGLRALTIEN